MAGPLTIPITGGATAAGGGFLSSIGGLGGVGSFLSGLGSLGGMFGSGGDGIDVSENRRLIKMQTQEALRSQGPLMRGQVAAAKSAGLHPLFAMGYQPPAGQPVIGGQPRSGGGASDALRKTGQAMMAYEQHKAAMAESKARTAKDTAQASLLGAQELSELRRMQANPKNDIPALVTNWMGPDGKLIPAINWKGTGLEPPEALGGYYHGAYIAPTVLD